MTTITPDHDNDLCHAASEERRKVLERLRELAAELENCENEARQQKAILESGGTANFASGGTSGGACSSCFQACGNPDCEPCSDGSGGKPGGFGSGYSEKRKLPLIVFPDYPPRPDHKLEREGGPTCDCSKRNGLQDQCSRIPCKNNPDCTRKPEPLCPIAIAAKEEMGDSIPDKPQREQKQVPICCKCPADCGKNKT